MMLFYFKNAFRLLMILLPISVTAAQVANITIPPRAVNVSINEVAEFNCTAVANSFTWQANGQQIDNGEEAVITPVLVNETKNIRMSTLTLMSVSNSTNVTCTAIRVTNFSRADSDPALLLVQGLLEPVSDLTVVPINSTTVLISWSPPFTLEGVPILGYNVTIANTTSGEDETMSVEGDTAMLYYSIDHPDPDNNFTVTVVPINGAGPGEDAIKFIQIRIPVIMMTTTNKAASVSSSSSSSTASSSTSIPIPTPDRDDNQITALVLIPVTITMISCAIILITICSIVTVVTCCLVLSKKRRRLSPPQDVVLVSANPAYEQVTLKSIALQENSAYSIVHTVSPPATAAVAEYEYIGDRKQLTNSPPQLDDEVSLSPNPAYRQVNRIDLQENSAYSTVHTVSPAAAAAQYENIGDRKHGNDELTAANSPPQQDVEVPVSPNPAYRQVNNITLQENSAYSIVHTVSPAAAQYKNIAVDDELTAANSPPQYEVPVSPNPAYKQVTSIALQENSAYSIVHTVSPPAAVAEYENIGDRKHGNDELTAANSPPQLDEISLSPNPAYRQVNNITLQENSAYSIVHTASPPAAAATHYENIAVDDKLTAANSLPQDEVPVSPNPAYRQVTSIALQENSAYSIVHTVSPPAAAVTS